MNMCIMLSHACIFLFEDQSVVALFALQDFTGGKGEHEML